MIPTANALVTNVDKDFADYFTTKNPEKWDYSDETSPTQFTRSRIDGNVAGCSYLVASLSALLLGGDEWTMLSKETFTVPYEAEIGMSLSQRINGQEISCEVVAVDATGQVIAEVEPAAIPCQIGGTVTVVTNVWTFSTTVAHNLRPGDWVYLAFAQDSRLNVGPVILGAGTFGTTIVLTSTLANATYNLGPVAVIRRIVLSAGAQSMAGTRFWGATAGNADIVSRNYDPRGRVEAWNPGNTQDTALVPNEGGLNYASVNYVQPFRARGNFRLEHSAKRLLWRTRDSDITSTDRSQRIRSEPCPTFEWRYKIRIRAKNLPNLSVPVGSITAAAKVASTTAALTIPNHKLSVGDFIVVYGIRDQVNFANLTTATVVASVVDKDNITIAFGISATANSYGGFVVRVSGGQIPTLQNNAVQTYAKTTDGLRLSLVGSATWTETIGHTVSLSGLVTATPTVISALHGRYRVSSIATTTMELEALDGQDLTGVSTAPTNAGGTVIRNTDLRLHMLRVYDRQRVETDINGSGSNVEPLPFTLVGTGTVGISGNPVLGAGANAIGDVGVQYRANNTGAGTISHKVAAASTNASNIKAAAGRLISYNLSNTTAIWKYVKLHNSASAPTAGAGVVMTIGIPPNGNASRTIEGGAGFSAGIGITMVTGAADADATAVAANDIVGDLIYA